MKITFSITRPIRNPAGLLDFNQSAKSWISTLMKSLGDQLQDGGDGCIGMDIEGVGLEFRVVRIPGVLETHRVEVESPNVPYSQNKGDEA